MHIRTSLSFWSTTFFASLGLTPLTACGGSTRDGLQATGNDAGHGGSAEGGGETGGIASGGTSVGGNGSGGSSTGGNGAGGASAGGGGNGTGGTITASGGYEATGGVASGGSFSGGAGGQGAGGAPMPPCQKPRVRVDGNGQPTGFVDCDGGATHRTVKRSCVSSLPRPGTTCNLPPPPSGPVPIGSCTTDANCNAHPNGYCESVASTGVGPGSCACQYGCVRDEDCGPGSICDCGSLIGQCVPATCTTDADCGESLCLGNQASTCGGLTFGCLQPNDTCTTNLDCTTVQGSAGICTLSMGVRTCSPWSPCGTGRPFLVGDVARVAWLAERRDWSTSIAPALHELDESARAALAERWTEIALMEHASIAAFARFALELLGMGAPPELLIAAQAAMLEETAHARDAFALASAYAGRAVGPGTLDLNFALTARSPVDIVRTAILEGCIGETVAAVEAAEALAHATDPTVRQVLERVTADETRHAELAWRFVRWVMQHGDAELRVAAAEQLATVVEKECAASRAASKPAAASDPVLLEHGIIEAARRSELRRRILEEVIAPCARALAANGARAPGFAPARTLPMQM